MSKNRKPGTGRHALAPQPVKHASQTGEEHWEELGDILVSFGYALEGEVRKLQTKAHYSQGDRSMMWQGVATDELATWIFEQARTFLPAETLQPPEPSVPPEDSGAPPTLEITQFTVAEAAMLAAAGSAGNTAMLRASCRLHIHHPPRNAASDFRAELLLADSGAGPQRLVAVQTGAVEAGEVSHDIHWSFPVPTVGRYQMKTVITLSPSGCVSEAEGPLLRVE